MEPHRSTDLVLSHVLEEDREPVFRRPEFGTTRADFERLNVNDS
jgi:hypothetical protein